MAKQARTDETARMPTLIPEDNKRFNDRYSVSGEAAMLAAEAETLGSDYQANGYTTLAEADELGRLLALAPGQVLLDVGAGCGWPGLHLATRHGCAVLSIDPVAEGMGVAAQRSSRDGLSDRSWAVQANAAALPVRSGSVDAVVHTDLLC